MTLPTQAGDLEAHDASTAVDPDPDTLPQSFDELGLNENILASLRDAGFTKPSPIQALFIPRALTGIDVMGQAKTGTGKTAAFLLPVFQRVKPGEANPSVLILAPTRELALQIHSECERLGKHVGLSSVTLYGGSSYEPQIEALARGVDLIVGTPGRVMDHMRSRRLDLSNIRVAILDEADRMLDLGFRKDIEYILRHCNNDRQTLLLSATIATDIKRLAQRFMNEPEEVWTAPERLTVDEVEQFYLVAERPNKWPTLLKLLDTERPSLAIIFCRTKHGAKDLARKLKTVHINAREIHGDLVQSKREHIMGSFRKGKVQILVATDVASRGIDVDNISHIVNYDIPYKKEDYVHRIGRTGRMNKKGKAYTLVTREEAEFLTEIEILINREITAISFEDLKSHFWPKPPAAPLPEFALDDSTTSVSEADYLQDDDRGGKGGRGGSSRGGSGGGRGRDRDRGGRGGRSGSGGGGRGRSGVGSSSPAGAAPAASAPGGSPAATADTESSQNVGGEGDAAKKKRRRRRRGKGGRGGSPAPGGGPSTEGSPDVSGYDQLPGE